MTTRLVTVYPCADGRDFSVEWPDAETAASTWYWDPEHNPRPLTPMDEAAWSKSHTGSGRARAEAGFAPTDVFIGSGSLYVHGFSYSRDVAPAEEVAAQRKTANDALRAKYGTAPAFWEQWGLPRIKDTVEWLRNAPIDAPIARLIEEFGYGFEQTFLMWGIDRDGLGEFLAAEYPEDSERLYAELSAGRPTATLEADQALWEIARSAVRHPEVRDYLVSIDAPRTDALASVSGGRELMDLLDDYMERFGLRTFYWDPSSPSLRENPDAVLALIRQTIRQDLPAPADLVAAASERRRAVHAEIVERLGSEPEKLQDFRRRAVRAEAYLGMKEGRALWQLSLCGALRQALLRKGRALVEGGSIGSAEDIFFLLPDDLDSGMSATESAPDYRSLIDQRRSEWEKWLGAVPPAQIGGESAAPEEEAPKGLVKGTGASRGSVTARARVLKSFEECALLLPGEVLVCTTTSPAWTPLFGIAAAIVSDGGGLLSHTAIAAREYGIPAVVGARLATLSIPNGALITVNGTEGTVIVEEEPPAYDGAQRL